MMSLTFGLFNQMSGLGPLGPLVIIFMAKLGILLLFGLNSILFMKSYMLKQHICNYNVFVFVDLSLP